MYCGVHWSKCMKLHEQVMVFCQVSKLINFSKPVWSHLMNLIWSLVLGEEQIFDLTLNWCWFLSPFLLNASQNTSVWNHTNAPLIFAKKHIYSLTMNWCWIMSPSLWRVSWIVVLINCINSSKSVLVFVSLLVDQLCKTLLKLYKCFYDLNIDTFMVWWWISVEFYLYSLYWSL